MNRKAKTLPKRLANPFLDSIRDFNREAREIDPKTEAKRIKTQEDKEEVEELLMHAARIKGAADSALPETGKAEKKLNARGAHQRRGG